MKYYLSKEEFQDTMLHLEDHKSKYINNNGFNFGKTVEFVTIKRRVSNYSSKENPNPGKKKQLALEAIEKYYDHRGLKRKLGFAGLGIDEDRRQCPRKKIAIEDTYNLNLLADACCSIEKMAKVKSRKSLRKAVKMKKSGNNGKRKKGKDTRDYDLTKVDYKLPPEYLEKIKKLNNGRNEQLIAQKQLTASDINPNLGRLLLNQKNIITEEFLRDDEEKKIRRKDNNKYIKAKLLEPMGRIQDIHVTNWDMVRNSYYVLLNTWKDLVASNGFGKNDVVQVWTFRFDGEVSDQLGVAVVRIFTAPREIDETSQPKS
ncbi:putative B3 domain-containing protein At5g35780 [Silene latifolia]|uniref:putative B3 domain-containing protein At5g35780 n=1 Tax=Silene latifolia TaxID=37657 RepID=UPI003D77C8F6